MGSCIEAFTPRPSSHVTRWHGSSYGATVGPQRGWLAASVWPSWLVGAILLASYVIWAWHHQHPAIDLTLLRHQQTALAVGLSALASVVMFAVVFLLPVYIEDLQGLSPLAAVLTLFPKGVVTGLGTVLGNRLTALLLTGHGLAVGLAIQTLILTMVGGLSSDEAADANTRFNMARRLGGSIGIALIATFFQIRERSRVGQVLHQLGVTAKSANLGVVGLPHGLAAGMRERLAQAAARLSSLRSVFGHFDHGSGARASSRVFQSQRIAIRWCSNEKRPGMTNVIPES
ncbi:MAG: hypothetical protein M3Z66_10950 [Chloroflexota bacterium]|nr:hypothetical protein [Chloroflexota bacterium]